MHLVLQVIMAAAIWITARRRRCRWLLLPAVLVLVWPVVTAAVWLVERFAVQSMKAGPAGPAAALELREVTGSLVEFASLAVVAGAVLAVCAVAARPPEQARAFPCVTGAEAISPQEESA